MNDKSISGLIALGAYHKVEDVQIKNKVNMTFCVRSYSEDGASTPFTDQLYRCEYDILGENPIKQAYEYIKTIERFISSGDV